MKKKNLAFTLAEVLIVIGIIGVVAALTLPNLNHATGDKEKVTKVKKIYSALTEAFDRAQVIYGNADTWGNGLSTNAERNDRFAKRVTEFLKVSKDCGFDAGCFSSGTFFDMDGYEWEENYLESLQECNAYMVTLSDGMSLAFRNPDINFDRLKINVDIDGPNKGKNQYGNDIFDFCIQLSGINQLYPSMYGEDWTGNLDTYSNGNTGNVTAWVIENGNLDYLKCPDELNWETKTSCE